MLPALARKPDAPPSTQRLQVCPPSLRRALPAWWPLWLVALKRALARPAATRAELRLADARDDFVGALDGVSGEHGEVMRARLRWARSMRELWHLRPALFEALCAGLDEAQAVERMAPLARHFPTRAPRSVFAAFGTR
jgi:hypothetical protein